MVIPSKLRKSGLHIRKGVDHELRRAQRLAKYRVPLLFSRRGPQTTILLVLAMLTAGVLLLLRSADRPALTAGQKEQLACVHLTYLSQSLVQFQRDCGRFPTTEEGLRAIVANPGISNWQGPYTTQGRTHFVDPWTNTYHYAFSNDTVFLTCNGADGKPDTDDDMISPFFRQSDDDLIRKAIRNAKSGENQTPVEDPEPTARDEVRGTDIEVNIIAPGAPGSPQ